MKILSWNIWINCDFEKVKSFLSDADADIIGLQEVRDNDSTRDVIGFLNKRGYEYIFAPSEQIIEGKKYIHGPAVFSRLPIVYAESFLLEEGDGQRAVARIDVKIEDTIVHVFNAHLVHTHQQPSPQQETQVACLLKNLPSDRVIVMGDFNATPESKTIQLMKENLRDTGNNLDVTWSIYPAGCEICNPQSLDTRLDYIFISKDLKPNGFEVESSQASDHLPISVNVEL